MVAVAWTDEFLAELRGCGRAAMPESRPVLCGDIWACVSPRSAILSALRVEWTDWEREGQECSETVLMSRLSKWWDRHHPKGIRLFLLEPINGRPHGQTNRAGVGQVCPAFPDVDGTQMRVRNHTGKCLGWIPKHGPVQEEEGVWHGRPIHWVESCATLTQAGERDIYEPACSNAEDW